MNAPLTESQRLASEQFRFRLVARGERANTLVALAVNSLKRCHPNVGILVIDANDAPTINQDTLHIEGDFEIIHVPPDEDDVSLAVGRGSRQHLFYWRHSPQLLSALPASNRYDVHSDADILFVRPLDLTALLSPLARGRIAAAVDESTLDYYRQLEHVASTPAVSVFPAAGSGGPLLQGGLLFTNPDDDGGFYDLFWQTALGAAESGYLHQLPWDDMGVITALLGPGGPLWERLLPLGHEWNYITDAQKDPGVFGCAAHFGGHKAQAMILAQRGRLLPRAHEDHLTDCWGAVAAPGTNDAPIFVRGPWRLRTPFNSRAPLDDHQELHSIPLPFSLTWSVPDGVESFAISAVLEGTAPSESAQPPDATIFVYVDGRLTGYQRFQDRRLRTTVRFTRAETVTVIGVSERRDCQAYLDNPFQEES